MTSTTVRPYFYNGRSDAGAPPCPPQTTVCHLTRALIRTALQAYGRAIQPCA